MKFKKPKFWDYQRPNLLSYILLPLTFPLILNNFLLNKKKDKKEDHRPKKICVGNIYVGGTAKTPLTIKIYQILNKLDINACTIKKFYKSHYDEQKILSEKTILYCEKNRIDGLNKAILENKDVAIFDDGLQDSSINYDLKIVCFNDLKLISKFKSKPKQINSKIKTICVGNIYIGGTGKTSLAIKIKEILEQRKIKVCFIKKFYSDQADEQKLLSKNGQIFISKKRTLALNEAISQGYNFAIFDDGLQDTSIKNKKS